MLVLLGMVEIRGHGWFSLCVFGCLLGNWLYEFIVCD
jgi:hypothetical protein